MFSLMNLETPRGRFCPIPSGPVGYERRCPSTPEQSLERMHPNVCILLVYSRPPFASHTRWAFMLPKDAHAEERGGYLRRRPFAGRLHDSCERMTGIVKTSTPSPCVPKIVKITTVPSRQGKTVGTTRQGRYFPIPGKNMGKSTWDIVNVLNIFPV